MREIKFSIWHKNENRWLDPWAEEDPMLSLKDSGEGCEVYLYDRASGDWSNKNCLRKDVVIQQYTNAKDCDDVEVYEGDILERKWAGEKGHETKRPVFVEFNSDNYGQVIGWNLMEGNPDGPKEAFEHYYGSSPSKQWRVIGNVLENPELLKEFKE